MRHYLFIIALLILVVLSSCSGGGGNPVVPSSGSDTGVSDSGKSSVPTVASDVLYVGTSRGTVAYKAYGIYEVILDPKTMTAELTPTRKAEAIGTTFDADLTQFLTVNPCIDCLKINGIRLAGTNQFEVGFAVKHPFADITKRPDLHGFDVRGIVISAGNYNFSLTQVATGPSTTVPARANVSLIGNADGWTHHFVELASDPNYFDPPKNYNVNINPFKRYFVDGGTPAFNPQNPSGHNVMKVGAAWETQKYIFNLTSTVDPIDFVFVVDCAYGQSATFQNRQNPYYFLPEFNRKEAWKVEVIPFTGSLQSHNTSSTVNYKVSVCDWQSGIDTADSSYPNTTNLGGISAVSKIKSVDIQIPFVSDLVSITTPDSGEGFIWNPYVYYLSVTNSQNAGAGWYYGIVAVRDDLQGKRGPIGIPDSPAGFPFPGPEIYDYSTYKIFQVRVTGSPPTIDDITYNSNPNEGDFVDFNVSVSEPDGDILTYHWEQTWPLVPIGVFADPDVKNATWQAPPLSDVPIFGVQFSLKLTVSDIDGQDSETYSLYVHEINSAPVCLGIKANPYWGVIKWWQAIYLEVNATDPDGDSLKYEWDFDWDGEPANFNIDATGQIVPSHTWDDVGFYKVCCKITEERSYFKSTYCSKDIVVEDVSQNQFKVDNSPDADPGYFQQDICMVRELPTKPVYHVAYRDFDDQHVLYCNDANTPHVFGNHRVISAGPSAGSTGFPKVAGLAPVIQVAWLESDSSVVPTQYKIKINSSIDGGRTFGAFGGERTVVVAEDPNSIGEADICAGTVVGQFYLVFSTFAAGNYAMWLYVTDDGGLTWHQPTGGSGAFRDVLNNTWAGRPVLKVSPYGTIHVLWVDYRSVVAAYYYDWSSDGGVTWNTDTLITDTASPTECKMAIDSVNNLYFAWRDNTNAYFRYGRFDPPPVLFSTKNLWSVGGGNLTGIDIWVSPSADIIIIPVSANLTGSYPTWYFYSFDYGTHLDRYFVNNYGGTQTADVVCDGRWESNPSRAEICSIWVDERTGLISFNDHIWGEFSYLAGRP